MKRSVGRPRRRGGVGRDPDTRHPQDDDRTTGLVRLELGGVAVLEHPPDRPQSEAVEVARLPVCLVRGPDDLGLVPVGTPPVVRDADVEGVTAETLDDRDLDPRRCPVSCSTSFRTAS